MNWSCQNSHLRERGVLGPLPGNSIWYHISKRMHAYECKWELQHDQSSTETAPPHVCAVAPTHSNLPALILWQYVTQQPETCRQSSAGQVHLQCGQCYRLSRARKQAWLLFIKLTARTIFNLLPDSVLRPHLGIVWRTAHARRLCGQDYTKPAICHSSQSSNSFLTSIFHALVPYSMEQQQTLTVLQLLWRHIRTQE